MRKWHTVKPYTDTQNTKYEISNNTINLNSGFGTWNIVIRNRISILWHIMFRPQIGGGTKKTETLQSRWCDPCISNFLKDFHLRIPIPLLHVPFQDHTISTAIARTVWKIFKFGFQPNWLEGEIITTLIRKCLVPAWKEIKTKNLCLNPSK